eukprot:10994-Heterococcus_DN1.PRE.2
MQLQTVSCHFNSSELAAPKLPSCNDSPFVYSLHQTEDMTQAHPIVEPAAVSLRLNKEEERGGWPDGCVVETIHMGFKVTFTVGECATSYAGGGV